MRKKISLIRRILYLSNFKNLDPSNKKKREFLGNTYLSSPKFAKIYIKKEQPRDRSYVSL